MRIGNLITLQSNTDVRTKFSELREMGLDACQLVCWDMGVFGNEPLAEVIVKAKAEFGVTITAFWCGWEGRCVWDLQEGQVTLGIVPLAYRAQRMKNLKDGSNFAKKIGVNALVTHVGFIPENPYDPNYQGVLTACKEIAEYCYANGQKFLFETGQETPLTLKRTIQDIEKSIGSGKVGINLDPANLIIYGKGNPVDALDVFGEHVCNIHGKDGVYSNDGYSRGWEVPMGEGKVNYPAFIRRLKEIGYDGDITIEREISGEKQKRDIVSAIALLRRLSV